MIYKVHKDVIDVPSQCVRHDVSWCSAAVAVNYHNKGAPTAYNHLFIFISSIDTLTDLV